MSDNYPSKSSISSQANTAVKNLSMKVGEGCICSSTCVLGQGKRQRDSIPHSSEQSVTSAGGFVPNRIALNKICAPQNSTIKVSGVEKTNKLGIASKYSLKLKWYKYF